MTRRQWPLSDQPGPSRSMRVVVALVIAIVAGVTCYFSTKATPTHPPDFGIAWFGAKALLHGADPYRLVGPGLVYDWPWNPLYPATAMLVALPFSFFPLLIAAMLFASVSAGLLSYGISADGWYRMPMFVSASFWIGVGVAQWAPLMTAALTIPALAVVFAAKPNLGAAMFLAGSSQVRKFALAGGAVLIVASLFFLPKWPAEWVQFLGAGGTVPPFMRLGGAACLLSLLRWRRPESWLVAGLTLVPQTGSWYELLPLFLIPATLRESMVLCSLTGLAFLFQDSLMTAANEVEFNTQVSALMIASGYLPATIMILRRPNVGPAPLGAGTKADMFALFSKRRAEY